MTKATLDEFIQQLQEIRKSYIESSTNDITVEGEISIQSSKEYPPHTKSK